MNNEKHVFDLSRLTQWLNKGSHEVTIGDRQITQGEFLVVSGFLVMLATAIASGMVPGEFVHGNKVPGLEALTEVYKKYTELLNVVNINGEWRHIPTIADALSRQFVGNPLSNQARTAVGNELRLYNELKTAQIALEGFSFFVGAAMLASRLLSKNAEKPLQWSTLGPAIARKLTAGAVTAE